MVLLNTLLLYDSHNLLKGNNMSALSHKYIYVEIIFYRISFPCPTLYGIFLPISFVITSVISNN